MLEEEEDRIQAVLLLTLCLPDINRHTLQVQNTPFTIRYCLDSKYYSSRQTLFSDLRTTLFQATYITFVICFGSAAAPLCSCNLSLQSHKPTRKTASVSDEVFIHDVREELSQQNDNVKSGCCDHP